MKLWLTVAEGAEYAGVCPDTLYSAVERREIRHVRVSGRRAIRLKREWIDEWFERYTRDAVWARVVEEHAPRPLGG
jgi:excisionase family DNA binding protein